jgi:hypothetical protein
MEGGDGGGNDSDMWLKGIVGFAIYHGALQTPTSSYPYRVVFDGNGNHVVTYTDGVAAGEYYGQLEARGWSSALVASDGSIINTNKDFFRTTYTSNELWAGTIFVPPISNPAVAEVCGRVPEHWAAQLRSSWRASLHGTRRYETACRYETALRRSAAGTVALRL